MVSPFYKSPLHWEELDREDQVSEGLSQEVQGETNVAKYQSRDREKQIHKQDGF